MTPDLIQDVCLEVMKIDNKKLNRLYPKECYKYFNGIATTLFFRDPKYKSKYSENAVSIELAYNIKDETEEYFNQYAYMLELDLTPNESLWVRTYLKFEGNFTWIANATGISRQHCSNRIKYISKKYGRSN